MKKVLLFVLMFMFMSVGAYGDVGVNASGSFLFSGNYLKDNKDDSFNLYQRTRIKFSFIANEHLKGVLGIQVGGQRWGEEGLRFNDNMDVNVKTRYAYIDFGDADFLNTRVGLQQVTLPSIFGSHILNDRFGSILINKDMGFISPTIGYGRLYDETKLKDDSIDIFMVLLPFYMSNLEITPFGTLTNFGKELEGKQYQVYHLGLHNKIDFTPFIIKSDVNYGFTDDDYKQQGYIIVVSAEYVMNMMTPQLFGFYETGEKQTYDNTGKSRRMPVIGTEGGDFGPGVGFGGKTTFNDDKLLRHVLLNYDTSYQTWQGAIGSVGAGFGLNKISFMDKLSSDFVAFYMKGTNHKDNVELFNTEDSYYEVNLNNTYMLYDNLALIVELGYGKVKFEDKVIDNDHLYRVVSGFGYKF